MYGATIGKLSIWGADLSTNQACAVAQPYQEFIGSEFLYYFLLSQKHSLVEKGKGGAQPNISQSILKACPIWLPPRDEQRRIVAKIEELFSGLDKGVESLKTARAQLTVYRQAVLKNAFEGKLTAQWRVENKDKLETAEQLLSRINRNREARFEQQIKEWKEAVIDWEENGKHGRKPIRPKRSASEIGISISAEEKLPTSPRGWAWVRIRNIAEVSGGLTKNQKRNHLPRKMKYLRVANVYADTILTDDVREIGVTNEEANKVQLNEDDLLIVEGNGSIQQIGRVAMWQGELPACGHQNHLIRVRLVTKSVPRFLLLFLLSPLGRELIVKEASSTSGLYTLSLSKVENLIVPVADPSEELAVVDRLDEKLSRIDKLIEEVEAQLAGSAALRQSILKKAFSGELVEQDPDDEPTAALLTRIKAEKSGQQSRTRTPKLKLARV